MEAPRVRATDEFAPLLVLRIEETAVAAEDRVETRAYLLWAEWGPYGQPVAEQGPKPT
ncbi:MAG TPA: hypothetical protein VK732_08405 [Verrucomicrobiae bacterium]|nr:hypothetical protein [Verrucomicrobiae bacterium]